MEENHPNITRIMEEELIDYQLRSRFYHPNYVKSLGLAGTERVLEFGSGGGSISRVLAGALSPEGALTCVEISPYWIEKARHRLKAFSNISYHLGDITQMALPADHFDTVIMHFVLHDIEPATRAEIVSTLAQCLRPEGSLFIREPANPLHGMPLSEIRSLMRNAGLREIRTGCTRTWRRTWICGGTFKKSW